MGDTRERVFAKYFGLSRMSHSVLDVAHPAVGALLVLGGFPSLATTIIGLLAAFAGFTSVFALNDLMDWRVDAEKMAKYRKDSPTFDLDSLGQRHPIAQGTLRYRAALTWVIGWGVASLVLAFVLKPICAVLLLAAVALETGYCLLLRVTWVKTFLSGCMVAVGGMAGVYAVSSAPPSALIAVFFIWAFAWEIGGRNIVNDWTDLEEDTHLGIRTTPVRFGRRTSSLMSLALLILTVLASLAFSFVAPASHRVIYDIAVLAAGAFFLLIPAGQWVAGQRREQAMALFNRACLYPLAVCLIMVVLAIV